MRRCWTTPPAAVAETTQVTVAAEAADNNACGVEILPADADTATAGHQVDLANDGVVVTVTVTAADCVTTGTYTLTVSRGGTRPAAAARLNLQGVPGLGFDPGQRRYQIHTPPGRDQHPSRRFRRRAAPQLRCSAIKQAKTRRPSGGTARSPVGPRAAQACRCRRPRRPW